MKELLASVSRRPAYRPSGRVNLPRFLPLTLLVVLVASLLAILLHVAYVLSFYFVLMVPIFAVLLLAPVLLLAVHSGQCRNRLAAGLVGAVAGTLVYVGHYHVGLVHLGGPAVLYRIDLLPAYIALRMETDEIRNDRMPEAVAEEEEQKAEDPAGADSADGADGADGADDPDEAAAAGEVDPGGFEKRPGLQSVGNWALGGAELFLVLLFACFLPVLKAGRPFCERCRRWMRRELARFPTGHLEPILGALANHPIEGFPPQPEAPVRKDQPHTLLAVDYCPRKDNGMQGCQTYISAKAANGLKARVINEFDTGPGKKLVRLVELGREELPLLTETFPALATITDLPSGGNTGPREPRSLFMEPPQGDRAPQDLARRELPPGESATRQNVRHEGTGEVLSTLNKTAALFLTLWPLGRTFLEAAATGGLILLLLHVGEGAVSMVRLVFLGLVGGGGIIVIAREVRNLKGNMAFHRDRYFHSLARAKVLSRSRYLVDPDHPDARFVEITPRENWHRIKLETAVDVGFLLVDARERRVLYEGDSDRYILPGAAITYCEVEELEVGAGSPGAVLFHVVVVRSRSTDGDIELPFIILAKDQKRIWKLRDREAQELRDRITEVMSPTPARDPTGP